MIFSLILISNLFAQSLGPQKADSVAAKNFCWRGQSAQACKVFAITEFGFSHRFVSDKRSPDSKRWLWTAEIGAMINNKAKSAWGATLLGSVDYDEFRWGLRPRYRRWVSRTTSLDVAPGIVLNGGDDNRLRPRFPAFSGQVCLCFKDLVGLTVQMDITRGEKGKTRTELYAGIRGGAEIGIVVILLLVVAAIGQ